MAPFKRRPYNRRGPIWHPGSDERSGLWACRRDAYKETESSRKDRTGGSGKSSITYAPHMPQHDSETPHIPHYSEQQRQPDVGSHQVAQTSTGPPTYRSGKEGVEQVLEGTVHDIGRNGTGDPVVKLSDGMVVFVVYKDGQPKPQPGDTIRFRIDSHKEKFCFGKPVS